MVTLLADIIHKSGTFTEFLDSSFGKDLFFNMPSDKQNLVGYYLHNMQIVSIEENKLRTSLSLLSYSTEMEKIRH